MRKKDLFRLGDSATRRDGLGALGCHSAALELTPTLSIVESMLEKNGVKGAEKNSKDGLRGPSADRGRKGQ